MYGVEIVPQAIEDAKNNAKLNGITNAQFFVGKAEEVLPQFYADAKKNITKGIEAIRNLIQDGAIVSGQVYVEGDAGAEKYCVLSYFPVSRS